MPTKAALTIKQENFCQKYLETGSLSEAYRESYDTRGMKPESVNRKAKELADNGKITARIQELQAAHRIRHNITVASLIVELEQARQNAKASGNSAAMVNATMMKARFAGLLDKVSN